MNYWSHSKMGEYQEHIDQKKLDTKEYILLLFKWK